LKVKSRHEVEDNSGDGKQHHSPAFVWDSDTALVTKGRQGVSKKNHGWLDSIRQAPRHFQL